MCTKSILNKPLSVKIAILGWGSGLLLWVLYMVVEIVKAVA